MNLNAWNLAAERMLLSVWQVSLTTALVILPLLALRKLLRRRYPARALCLVWAALLVRLLIPVQISLPRAPVRIAPQLTQVRYTNPAAAVTPDGPVPAPPAREWVETVRVPELAYAEEATCYGAWLFLAWGGTALLLFAGQMAEYLRYSRRLRRSFRAVGAPALLATYQAERERLGVRREIPLVQSPLADGPMLIGLLRPALALPLLPGREDADGFGQAGLSPESAPLVLRHELTHYQRHDLWLKLAACAARRLHWFNPAVYLLTRALHEDIELACDSRVVEGLDNRARKLYGAAILDCAANRRDAKQPLTTRFSGGKETLKTRLGELFAAEAKKRGAPLLLMCLLTVAIVGGAVTFGGSAPETSDPAPFGSFRSETPVPVKSAPDGQAPAAGAEPALLPERLTEETAVLLAGAWADGWAGRNMETAMPYLTRAFQETVFDSMLDPEAEDGARFSFDPDDPHYGVPEENRRRFWHVGVSSPWINGRAVIPDLAGGGAYIVYGWLSSANPETRTLEYVHFARENGAWRISGVDGSDSAYGAEADDVLNTAEKFRLIYGNDLGLPDCFPYLDYVSTREDDRGDLFYRIDDPVTAAVNLLGLEGGSGEVTGTARVRPDRSGVVKADPAGAPESGEADGFEHTLGRVVTYTFADGSAVDLVMADVYGEGYIPVDWSIDGENSRTMLDLACQWARGTIYKDTHGMFPLLTEHGANELIAVQVNYSGGTGEWYWKHGKYGSSPTAQEFGVFLDAGEENAVRVTYALGSSGEFLYRESEILRFVQTPAGLKLDSVRELTRHRYDRHIWTGGNANAEYRVLSEQEWFAMHYMTEPVAGDLTDYRHGFNGGVRLAEHRDFMEDPLEMAKQLLYISDDNPLPDCWTRANAVLVSASESSARVRLDFTSGGAAFVDLNYNPDGRRWQIAGIRDAAAEQIDSAAAFREAYADLDFLGLTAYRARTALSDLARLYHYEQAGVVNVTDPLEVDGHPFGMLHDVVFPDGSTVRMALAERQDGGVYPADWSVDGRNTRTVRDLATQWAVGYADKDVKPLYLLLNENGLRQLAAEQDDPGHFFTDHNEWDWRLHRYLASVTGYTLRQTAEDEAEIVYTETGRGFCNHSAVQRLYFTREPQGWRIDRWEELEPTTEPYSDWYREYCLPSLRNFTKSERDPTPANSGHTPEEEAAYWALEFAGLNDHEILQANVQSVEAIYFAVGSPPGLPGYEVVLRFTDESGWLTVTVYPTEDGDGWPVWNLYDVKLHDRDPDAEVWFQADA